MRQLRRPIGLLLVAACGLIAGCSDDPEAGAPAAGVVPFDDPPGGDASAYVGAFAGAFEEPPASSFEEMREASDWVVLGTIIDIVSGRTFNGDTEGDVLYYAEVMVAVEQELAGDRTDEAVEVGADGSVVARVEFLLPGSPESIPDLAAALPDGQGIWFLHHKVGEGEEAFYRVEDAQTSLVVREPDETAGLPLYAPPGPPAETSSGEESYDEGSTPLTFEDQAEAMPYEEVLQAATVG